MKNCFSSAGEIEIFPLASTYPWDNKKSNSFFEGTWVILDGQI
jgi:hypothetical protein